MLSKEKRIRFNKMLDQYTEHLKTTNDPDYIPEVKCISDRILLYIRYGIFRSEILFKIPENDVAKLKHASYFLYEKVRGSEQYTNKDPRLVAASIVYIACVMQGIPLTQMDIGDVFYTNPASIREHYKRMKKLEKL